MRIQSLSGLVVLFSVLALGAGATTPALVGDEPTYVAAVEVVQSDASVPAGFADALRTVLLDEAALYGAAGRPITLRIEVSRVHFKNPVQAMIIGDNDSVRGQVTVQVADAPPMAGFRVQVGSDRSHGISGAGLAMGLLEILDPTGMLGVADSVGSAASSDINRSGTAVALRANFADETLRRTFGDARTRAVIAARREALRNAHHDWRPNATPATPPPPPALASEPRPAT
jgi:hypothetical protein